MNSTEQHSIALQSVNELVTSLIEEERTEFANILKTIDFTPSAFQPFSSWSNECYTRNCIFENEKFELILLCWEQGQMTPIHDHGGEECWVKIIEGEFREIIYKMNDNGTLATVQSNVSTSGDISYMVDFMGCHSLENTYPGRSMSLHLYAKPIRNCQLFDEESKKFIRKELEYDTVSELIENEKK